MILPKLRHVLLAGHRKGHGIHSPFLYHLVNQVLFDKNRYYSFDSIESQFNAPPKEHLIGQTLFRLAEDIEASTIVVCDDSDSVDMVYMKSARANAHLVRLTDSEAIRDMTDIDLAVFDLYHNTDKLTNLFDVMLLHARPTSVFVFKHIHKKGMEHCWNAFINHPRVTTSLDVFYLGIVFFRPDFEKKLYRIRQ